MEKIIQDKELGEILLRTSPRARRNFIKICRGKITATMPPGGDETHILAFIQENREKICKALEKYPASTPLTDETVLQTISFRLRILRMDCDKFQMQLKDEVLHIACPQTTDFTDHRVQEILKFMLEKALRHEANRLLPQRLEELAVLHHFYYTKININNSKKHWGSCTPKRSINLSLSLMLLPPHLIDYVLLHELCHTVEMNHSKCFWALMDDVTDGKAQALRKELNTYHPL